VSTPAGQPTLRFDPAAYETFRFLAADLDEHGVVRLSYALDDGYRFEETVELPVPGPLSAQTRRSVAGLVSLLHLVAGVSYFKTAAPPAVALDAGLPGPAGAALLEALYSEGLGEFAYTNRLPSLPRPRFASDPAAAAPHPVAATGSRTLVPIGGGKDSVVALEAIRRSGREFALFSVGDATPIAQTAAIADVPRLIARRHLDPKIGALNGAGALNGHVPVTAVVSLIALLTAALNGFDAVAMANERSASTGNVRWDGIDVNHQFSKGLRAEELLRAALAEVPPGLDYFSALRPLSELAIAKAFARFPQYHGAFTSCNAVFRIDPERRATAWCRDCPKCRFVFLALAPFSEPDALRAVFGGDLLDDPAQYDGFALLAATGGLKPFECVGEETETVAAFRMLAEQPAWRDHAVVRRFAAEVLPGLGTEAGDVAAELAWSDRHHVPEDVLRALHEVLRA
jgi:hypothetical protein